MMHGAQMNEHIHTPEDGRGYRAVTLDGKPITGVVYADTRKGKVVFYDQPPRMHKHGKRLITRTRYGIVTVAPMCAAEGMMQ